MVSTCQWNAKHDILIAELAGYEEVSTLQDTETGGDRYCIEVLDLERFDLLPLVLDPTLEQISIFRLQEEEECALHPSALGLMQMCQAWADPDFVHDSSHDDISSTRLSPLSHGVSPTRNRNSVSLGIHVLPDDVVLATDKDT